MLYKILLIFAKHQHKSAMGIHMSPPSWASLPLLTPSSPSRLSQSPSFSSLSHTANSHWLSILHMVKYMFQCYSPNLSNLGLFHFFPCSLLWLLPSTHIFNLCILCLLPPSVSLEYDNNFKPNLPISILNSSECYWENQIRKKVS